MGARVVLGVDEAGRGALAGPLVFGACAFQEGSVPSRINDSKSLSPTLRAEIADEIRGSAMACGVGEASVSEIDEKGMSKALRLAALRACESALRAVETTPGDVRYLIDGPVRIIDDERSICVVRGDSFSTSIAAASILAKVHRDSVMTKLAALFPAYGFDRHKGYGTPEHLRAIERLGPSVVHRMSFSPFKSSNGRAQGKQEWRTTLWEER